MVTRVLLGVAVVFFSVASWLAYENAVTYNDPGEYAFEYVCDSIKADCSELEAPEIRFGPYQKLMGSLGFYYSTESPNSIYLDLDYAPTLESGHTSIDPMAWSVLVHETTHYVDRKLGITSGESCAVESLGWHVGNSWLLDHGHYDLVVWDWYTRYNKCSAPTN